MSNAAASPKNKAKVEGIERTQKNDRGFDLFGAFLCIAWLTVDWGDKKSTRFYLDVDWVKAG
jgi:hypothetical protein